MSLLKIHKKYTKWQTFYSDGQEEKEGIPVQAISKTDAMKIAEDTYGDENTEVRVKKAKLK